MKYIVNNTTYYVNTEDLETKYNEELKEVKKLINEKSDLIIVNREIKRRLEALKDKIKEMAENNIPCIINPDGTININSQGFAQLKHGR